MYEYHVDDIYTKGYNAALDDLKDILVDNVSKDVVMCNRYKTFKNGLKRLQDQGLDCKEILN